MRNTGKANTALIQKRRVMSRNSALFSTGALRGSNAMPHFGQLPGPMRTTSGCMGQVYSIALVLVGTGATGSSVMPHFGQFPGAGWRISGCIGQV